MGTSIGAKNPFVHVLPLWSDDRMQSCGHLGRTTLPWSFFIKCLWLWLWGRLGPPAHDFFLYLPIIRLYGLSNTQR
eukprot:2995861-Amphidinium_carterae.1